MALLPFWPGRASRLAQALPLLFLFGTSAVDGFAESRPLDVSREACMRRLLEPGPRPDLATMISDAQVYILPEQRVAEDERIRNDQEAINSHKAAMELEFRQWERTNPRGTSHAWEGTSQQEHQERLEQQAAEHRAAWRRIRSRPSATNSGFVSASWLREGWMSFGAY